MVGFEEQFTPTRIGNFRQRLGPGGRDQTYSNKKVCVVATDKAYLVEVLYGISLRPECFWVKYSTEPKDGMYLGRCFLLTDQAAGKLCQEFKADPKLMVSLQDDDFFNQFRDE